MMPSTNAAIVKRTDAEVMREKNRHSPKVHRKDLEMNMNAHPARYMTQSIRKIIMRILFSRRTANHPYDMLSTLSLKGFKTYNHQPRNQQL
jgi:hypothetical protein